MGKKRNRWMDRLLAVVMAFTMVVALFPTSMASATEMPDSGISAIADDGSSGGDNENQDNGVDTVEEESDSSDESGDDSGDSGDDTTSTSLYYVKLVDSNGDALSNTPLTYLINGEDDQGNAISSDGGLTTDGNGIVSIDLSSYSSYIGETNIFTITFTYFAGVEGTETVSRSIEVSTASNTESGAPTLRMVKTYAISVSESNADQISSEEVTGTITYSTDSSSTAEADNTSGTSNTVEEGWTGTVDVEAPEGYWIYSITVTPLDNREDAYGNTEYSISVSSVSDDLSIAVVYEKYYTVSVGVCNSGEGTIEYTNRYTTVSNGDSLKVGVTSSTIDLTVIPKDGYQISSVTVNGAAETVGSEYVYSYTKSFSITEDTTISATFVKEYTVTISYDSTKGTVTSSPEMTGGTVKVSGGSSLGVEAEPNTGYHVSGVKVNGADYITEAVADNTTWSETFENITSDYTIEVTFAANSYTVSTETSGGGKGCSVTSLDEVSYEVSYDGSVDVTVAWEDGYYVKSINIVKTDDGKDDSGNGDAWSSWTDTYNSADTNNYTYDAQNNKLTFKVSNVRADITVNVEFGSYIFDSDCVTIKNYIRSYLDSKGRIAYVCGVEHKPPCLVLELSNYSKVAINDKDNVSDSLSYYFDTGEDEYEINYAYGASTNNTETWGVLAEIVTYWSCCDTFIHVVFDKTDPDKADINVSGDSKTVSDEGVDKVYYSGDATVKVNAQESETAYSGLASIVYWLDSETEPTDASTITSLYTYASGDEVASTADLSDAEIEALTFTIENDNADHTLYVKVTDRAGNSSIATCDINFASTEITVDMSGEQSREALDGGNYYNCEEARTVEIVITERADLFNKEGLEITSANSTDDEAVDITNAVFTCSDGVETGTDGVYKYTFTYTFSDEGKYDWNFEYTNKAGFTYSSADLSGGSVTGTDVYSFIYDVTVPGGYVTIDDVAFKNENDENGLYTSPLSTLSFAFFAKSINTATATCSDASDALTVAGINAYKTLYYKATGTTALTAEKLEELYAENPDDFSDTLYWTDVENETLVVYARIVDNAGNVTYVSSDGAIVDNTEPTVSIDLDEDKTEYVESGDNVIYTGDVTLDVTVKDPADPADKTYSSFSGLKSVVYWIEYNGLTIDSNEIEEKSIILDGSDDAVSITTDTATGLITEVTFKIAVDDETYDYSDVVVYVKATDNAENVNTYADDSFELDIDVLAPEIAVSYTDENDNDSSGGYYNAARTAEIVITEREDHFNYMSVPINITATDADENKVAWNNVLVIYSGDSETGTKLTYVEEYNEEGVLDAGTWTVSGDVILVNGWSLTETAGEPNNDTHTITIEYAGDANYTFTISAGDAAGNSNDGINYDVDSDYNEKFTVDTTNPEASITIDADKDWFKKFTEKFVEIITFGIISKNTVTVDIAGVDATSPITLEYYVAQQTNGTLDGSNLTVGGLEALDKNTENGIWTEGDAASKSIRLTYTNDQIVVYARVTDYAGHVTYVSSNGAISDTEAPRVTLTPADAVEDNGNDSVYGYYNYKYSEDNGGIVNVGVSVSDVDDENSYSALESVTYTVTANGVQTQSGTLFPYGDGTVESTEAVSEEATDSDPTYNELAENNAYTGNIEVDMAANNSSNVVVAVTATDLAGNSTTKHVTLDIDVTKPTIGISYDNNTAKNDTYFAANRTATIVITERTDHFDSEAVDIQIKATDANGNTVSAAALANMLSAWTTVEDEKDENGATHTATITYSSDANYTFSIAYTDKAGNEAEDIDTGNSVAPYTFTVDKVAPTGSIKVSSSCTHSWDTTWSELLTGLTFSRYSDDTVGVTLSAADVTSPIVLQYYVDSKNGSALSRTALNAFGDAFNLTDDDLWITVANASVLSRLSETLTQADDNQLVVYMRITDYAGNVTFISSDGYIIDHEYVYNTGITLTSSDYSGSDGTGIAAYYNANTSTVTVTVNASDIDDTDSFSGIKELSYEISANGVASKTGTFYTFENENPSLDEIKSALTGQSFTFSTADFNRCEVTIKIYAEDNAGNKTTIVTRTVDIDVTLPTVEVSYSDSGDNNGNGYYDAARTATIVVTERDEHFNYLTTPITITAVDADGEDVDLSSVLEIYRGSTKLTYVSAFTDGALAADTWTVSDGKIYVNGWALSSATDPNKDTHTIKVKYIGDANYTFTMSATDTAKNKNSGITYADTSSKYNTAFTVDTTAPTGSITIDSDNTWISSLLSKITFGIISNSKVSVKLTADDETSPIIFEYYVQEQTEETLDGTAMTVSKLEALDSSVWTTVTNSKDASELSKSLSYKDEQIVVYIRITDFAGNVTYIGSNGAISDTYSPTITLTPETPDVDNEKSSVYGYYNRSNDGKVTVSVDVSDVDADNNYSALESVTYQVLCNGEETQSGTLLSFTETDPTYKQLKNNSTYSGTIDVKASKNNSCDVVVKVTAVDKAGNKTTKSVKLDIDVTAPTIEISYNNNNAENSKYFDATRTATIVITERTEHFNSDDVNITITAVDAQGNTVSGATVSKMLSSWKTVEGSDENSATHTATITYSKDANYTFAISYTDTAGNAAKTADTGDSAAPYEFTVDTTAPTGTVTYTSAEGSTNTRSSLVKKLTFGFYSNSNITVTGTSDDVTSPVASVKYYKTSGTTALTKSDLNALSSSSWKTFKNVSVTSDEQFTVYLKITDNAGNYTYISTDGLIVDETRPVEETLAPEITLTQPVNDIYSGDVTVDVGVIDPTSGGTYSGLKSVTYEVYNLGELTQSGTLYSFTNESPTQSQLVQSITDTVKVLASENNSNDVEIVIYAEDNSGNTSQKSVTCQIDTTAPTIDVSYDNNSPDATNNDYFKEDRTATITITERNFDADDVVITVTNTDGTMPTISGWTKTAGTGNEDNTTWTATVTYAADGDYTFAIEYTDKAGNVAGAASYAAGTIAGEEFTIDKTLPTVSVAYSNTDVLNGNYYKAARTATITITEHNFDAGRVTITATENGSSMVVSPTWSTSGDVHTAAVSFTEDALYTFDIAYTDMAGNDAADYLIDSFYVDLTNPEIVISGVENESANTGTVMPVVTVTDTNYNSNGIEITVTGKRFGNTYSYTASETTDGQVFSYENIEVDDIYELTATATDLAGNSTTSSIEFSVNREGSTYDITSVSEVSSKYYWRSSDMSDLVFTETNPNKLSEIVVTLYKNSEEITLVEGQDYEVVETIGEGGWYMYTYTIFSSVFSEDGIYNISITSVDEAGNTTQNTLDTKSSNIQFVIDNTAPNIVVVNLDLEEASKNIFNATSYTVQISVTDNLSMKEIVVYIDGVAVRTFTTDEINAAAEGDGILEFTVSESSSRQEISVVAIDQAGNESEIQNISILVSTDAFARFINNTPLLVGTIIGVIVLIGLIIFLIIFFKRRKKDDKEEAKA